VNLGAVADGSVPMPITLGWVGRHGLSLLSSVVRTFRTEIYCSIDFTQSVIVC
jgi:hypothetical protein